MRDLSSPDTGAGATPLEGHNKPAVREGNPLIPRQIALDTFDRDHGQVIARRNYAPANFTAIDEGRRQMLQRLGSVGEAATHDALPVILERLVGADPKKTLIYGHEEYDGALINDAVANATPADIDRTITLLSSDGFQQHGKQDAASQACFTLVRQINGLRRDNPDSPELAGIRDRLIQLRDSGFVNTTLR